MRPLIAILLQGVAVRNPAAWQSAQVKGTAVGGLLLALINLAHVFGYALPVDISASDANEIGAAILTLFNLALSAASHEHIGILPNDRK